VIRLKRADVKVGFSCNNNCLFCFIPKKTIDRNTREIKNTLLQCKIDGVEKIVITGGEPTIRKDIIQILEYAKNLGFK